MCCLVYTLSDTNLRSSYQTLWLPLLETKYYNAQAEEVAAAAEEEAAAAAEEAEVEEEAPAEE